ncbi:hypothetical protein M3J09_005508 [Ascochyta lentis]
MVKVSTRHGTIRLSIVFTRNALVSRVCAQVVHSKTLAHSNSSLQRRYAQGSQNNFCNDSRIVETGAGSLSTRGLAARRKTYKGGARPYENMWRGLRPSVLLLGRRFAPLGHDATTPGSTVTWPLVPVCSALRRERMRSILLGFFHGPLGQHLRTIHPGRSTPHLPRIVPPNRVKH